MTAVNEALCDDVHQANKYANICMPIANNMGHLMYVLVAIVGGVLALTGAGGKALTLGAIAAFLQLTKSFTTSGEDFIMISTDFLSFS